MSVVQYILEMNLLQYFNGFIPTNIDTLIEYLDNLKINIWNYCIEDKDEIKDIKKVVLVYDNKGNKRYFEKEITQSF